MEWIRLILSLIGIIGLILFMFWMLRKVNKLQAVASGNKLRILDRANTGRDSSLLVVSVSGKLMLVGVSAGKIEKLCDLDTNEEEYFGSPENTADKPPGIKFSDVLYNFMNPGGKKRELRKIHEAEEPQSSAEVTPKGEGEENTVEPDN